ncbi:hypothetical protein GGI26_001652 [Coemansia sp. RSA 1358]|nr:hypothetical protein GGI26_001652 [Coemansia sp. RSA 1358]
MHVSNNSSLESIEKEVVKLGKRNMSEDEAYQYKVILAKIYFYNGKFDQCKEAISSLPELIDEDSHLSPAYTKHLYMSLMVMRGIILEMRNDLVAAHETYDKALVAFKSKLSSQSVIVVPRSLCTGGAVSSNQEELVNWPEEALYRRALLSLSLSETANGIRELASYLHHMDNVTPPAFRAFRRMRANRLYLQAMRHNIRDGAQLSPEVKLDIIHAHRRQIALLKSIYAFPKASETHKAVLDEVDDALMDWKLIHAVSRTEVLRLLEILYEAVYLTYNSPRVLRHLMRALVLFGDYHEARLALGTYSVLVERQMEGVKKAIVAAIAEGIEYKSMTGTDTENLDDILETVIAGAQLYLLHLSDPHECLSLIHFANDLIDDIKYKDPSHTAVPEIPLHIRAQLSLWKGAAHGRLAQKSREPKNRADHHSAALQLLQLAAEQSPRSYDAHYQLALEQTLGARDIAAATQSAKQAVALNPKKLEAWHILALLSTARKDYDKALQICETALRQSEWWSVFSDIQNGTLQRNSAEQGRNHLGLDFQQDSSGDSSLSSSVDLVSSLLRASDVESGIAFFDLAMTKMAIDGKVHGYGKCLNAQSHLFALYGCIYGSVHSYGSDLGDASSALEEYGYGVDSLTLGKLRVGTAGFGAHNTSPSQTSGKKSLARTLARSMFSKRSLHTRYFSHGGENPPLPPLAVPSGDLVPKTASNSLGAQLQHNTNINNKETIADKTSDTDTDREESTSTTQRNSDQVKRQRSMPHLRRTSRDSSIGSHDITPEAYFDTLGRSPRRTSSADLGVSNSGGGRNNVTTLMSTIGGSSNSSSVYYTQVPTRLGQQRIQAKRALCSLWLAAAASFVILERLDEASNAISEALLAWPESPEALAMRGQLEMVHKEYLPALNEFHAAVSLESSNIRASVGLARVEYLLGRRDVALGLLKNITRAHGWSDPEAWYWLGRLEREIALEQVDADDEEAREKLAQMPTMKRALEYTAYALDLESSQPVRPFSVLRP